MQNVRSEGFYDELTGCCVHPPRAGQINRRAGTEAKKTRSQEPAGDAAGLDSAGLASGAAADAAGLASSEGAIDAEASGDAGVSSDLLQAVAVKNIDTNARNRTLRITTSFVTSALAERAEL